LKGNKQEAHLQGKEVSHLKD